MRCEVCGREIMGPPQRRIIEGAKLTVCGRCAGFGSAEWSPTRPTRPAEQRAQGPRPQPRSDVDAVEQFALIEDYGAAIRKARQSRGLSVEDLAKKMQEKESIIKKLEQEELTPDPKLAQKIKFHLGIEVMEKDESPKGKILSKPTGPRTLGDLIQLDAKAADEGEEKDKPKD